MSEHRAAGERRVALVTGASRGIGSGVLQHLAELGMAVVGVARTATDLQRVVEKARAQGGVADLFVGDITDERVVVELFEWIESRFGRLDVLVNNAGIAIFGNVEQLETSEFQRVIDLDLVAAYSCTHQAIRLMKKTTGTGKIISIGSVRSHWTEWGDAGAYNAAKVGLHAMMESVARQLHGEKLPIAVGMICPGSVAVRGEEANSRQLPVSAVAAAVGHAVTAPPDVNIFDTVLIPIAQSPW